MKTYMVSSDRSFARSVSHHLQDRGHEVTAFSNGFDTLRALGKGDLPGLVLVDLVLKGVSGVTLCQCIKGNERTQAVKVVVFSGTVLEQPEELSRIGADGCIAHHKISDMLANVDLLLAHIASLENAENVTILGTENLFPRKAVHNLIHEKKFLENVLEALDKGVVVADEIGRIMVTNAKACTLLGKGQAELVGLKIQDVVPVNPGRSPKEAVRTEVPHRDGILEVLATRLDPEAGDAYLVVTLDDVTETRRRSEYWCELERQATLGSMVGGVAHEFFNLLTALRATSEKALLLNKDLSPEVVRDFEAIVAVVDQGTDITRGLVGISKAMFSAELREVDLRGSIDRVTAILASRLGRQGIRIVRDDDEDLPRIVVHEGKVVQILLNVVKNAVDAVTCSGWIRITTSWDETWVHVWVTDSGPGVPKELLEKIFQPFFTTKDQASIQGGGSLGAGLGLSESRRLAEELGGEIVAGNARGAGATFRLTLPRNRACVRVGTVQPAHNLTLGA